MRKTKTPAVKSTQPDGKNPFERVGKGSGKSKKTGSSNIKGRKTSF